MEKESTASPEEIQVDLSTNLPDGVSKYYQNLAHSQDPEKDPIAAQFIPRKEESLEMEYETADPISDQMYSVTPRLIHHYRDRALLLVNDRCSTYCRHCFRRHFTGVSDGRIQEDELSKALEYLEKTPQVQEILLSGGDPLMLPDDHLLMILGRIKELRPQMILRICTRIPVVLPSRVTQALTEKLKTFQGLWLVIQANHPREITAEFQKAVNHFQRSGIPVLNQSVLLKGVNDDPDILEDLFRSLLRSGVKPYYLFQGDLASGTRHFRTDIARGLEIMDILRSRLSGMGLPTYAVDLPGGGGKIPLNRGTVLGVRDGMYQLQGPDGKVYGYPVEK